MLRPLRFMRASRTPCSPPVRAAGISLSEVPRKGIANSWPFGGDRWRTTWYQIACAMFSPFLRVVWGLVRRDGTPTAVKIVFALFALPFAGVALGLLLSPLWHWIYTRGSVWVITDRRVIRFFGPFAKSWGQDKLFEHVEWSSSGHGCLDFAFSEHWVNSKGGGYMMTDCIENVRKKDVPFVKAAFLRLSECWRAGEAARQAEKMSMAEKCFRVREDAKRLSIVF